MEYLLVDAYNVINAWGDIFDFGLMTLEDCRDKLLHIMSNYQGYNGDSLSVIVVFDAHMAKGRRAEGGESGGIGIFSARRAVKAVTADIKNPRKIALEAIIQSFTGVSAGAVYFYDNIIVVYTKANETADNFIERFVYLKGETDTVRVVTSDYLEQTMILRKGGVRILPRELKEAVSNASREGGAAKAHPGVWTEVQSAKPGRTSADVKAGWITGTGSGLAGGSITGSGITGASMTAAKASATAGGSAATAGTNKAAITGRITTIDSLLNKKVAERLEDIRRGREARPEGGERPE